MTNIDELIILLDKFGVSYSFHRYSEVEELKMIRVVEDDWNAVDFIFDESGKFLRMGIYEDGQSVNINSDSSL